MTTKLLLHIGINKTGTSAIQHWFTANCDALQQRGLLYPGTGRLSDAHYSLATTLGFSSTTMEPADVGGMLTMRDALRREISMTAARQVVVSAEYLVLPRDLRPVQDMFRGLDTQVIVYLRRHDRWWESVYAQAVKQVKRPPFERGFGAFYDFQRKTNPLIGNYRALVDRWADAFGKENIIVRPYEAQQNQPDLIADFIQAGKLGEYTAGLDTCTPQVNIAPRPEALQLVEIFQRADVSDVDRGILVRHALSMPDTRDKKFPLLAPKYRRELAEANQADYEYIAREFLHRDDGRLFFDPLPDISEEWESPLWLNGSHAVEVAVQAMSAARKKNKVARKGLPERLLSFLTSRQPPQGTPPA